MGASRSKQTSRADKGIWFIWGVTCTLAGELGLGWITDPFNFRPKRLSVCLWHWRATGGIESRVS